MTFHQFRNIHSLHVALFTSTWMLEISSFSAVDCGALSFPLNGSSHGGSTTFPNSVHFSCDPGFILHGSSKRTCMATGSWSGIATTCAGKWKLNKHLKQPWTGNPFTHTRSFTTHYALTPTLIYSLIRRARRNCCLLQRLELCLAKERSSELFRENFSSHFQILSTTLAVPCEPAWRAIVFVGVALHYSYMTDVFEVLGFTKYWRCLGLTYLGDIVIAVFVFVRPSTANGMKSTVVSFFIN